MANKISVIIVDDLELLPVGLRYLLKKLSHIKPDE